MWTENSVNDLCIVWNKSNLKKLKKALLTCVIYQKDTNLQHSYSHRLHWDNLEFRHKQGLMELPLIPKHIYLCIFKAKSTKLTILCKDREHLNWRVVFDWSAGVGKKQVLESCNGKIPARYAIDSNKQTPEHANKRIIKFLVLYDNLIVSWWSVMVLCLVGKAIRVRRSKETSKSTLTRSH